jgi:hypothetical protein
MTKGKALQEKYHTHRQTAYEDAQGKENSLDKCTETLQINNGAVLTVGIPRKAAQLQLVDLVESLEGWEPAHTDHHTSNNISGRDRMNGGRHTLARSS